MPCANAVARSCVRPVANAVDAISGLSRPPGSLIFSDFMSGLGGADQLLNIALLGPQYQDGVLVGLQPACDDLAFAGLPGVRGMRTMGQVTNLVPNSEAVGAAVGVAPTGWGGFLTSVGITVAPVGAGNGYVDVRISGTSTATAYPAIRPLSLLHNVAAVVGDIFTSSAKVTLLSGDWSQSQARLAVWEYSGADAYLTDSAQSLLAFSGVEKTHTRTLTNASTAKVSSGVAFAIASGTTVDFTIRIERPQLTKTAYPVPYIPTYGTAVTQTSTAHNGTSGIHYAMPQNGAVWNQLSTAKPLTLAARIVTGVGSAEIPNSTTLNIRTCRSDPSRLLRVVKDSSGNCRVELHDGTNTAQSPIITWSRYQQLIVVGQVLNGGLQMRAGAKVGAGALSFGSAVTYAGSFGPDAVYSKLMLAHSNVYPVHTLKDWLADYQSTDSDILSAMGLAA